MVKKGSPTTILPPSRQPDAYLLQLNPGNGTPYTVLDTEDYVRIISIAANVTWSVRPNQLQVTVYQDGQSDTYARANPNSLTWYTGQAQPQNAASAQLLGTIGFAMYRPFLLEARNVRVTVTRVGGTVSQLECRVKWSKW